MRNKEVYSVFMYAEFEKIIIIFTGINCHLKTRCITYNLLRTAFSLSILLFTLSICLFK